jgi:type II secretory pathway pseudopilin PulG
VNTAKKVAFSLIELSVAILIIGLLLGGILGGADLIKDASLANAQKMTTNSEVGSIANLSLWLETTLPQSFAYNKIPEDNSKINAWIDINPARKKQDSATIYNDRTIELKQDTQNLQPIYKADAFSDLPAILFTSSQYFTSRNFFLYDLISQQEATIFMVQQLRSTNSTIPVSTSNDKISFGYNSGRIQFSFANSSITESSASLKKDKNRLFSAIKTADKIKIYKNSKIIADTNHSSSIDENSFASQTTLAVGKIDGYLGEIIIFSRALKEKEKKSIEDYLIKKWKINRDD